MSQYVLSRRTENNLKVSNLASEKSPGTVQAAGPSALVGDGLGPRCGLSLTDLSRQCQLL